MKKLHLIIYCSLFISCKQISKDVENSFTTMSIKMDSLTKIENEKVKELFTKINTKTISKKDKENAALVYNSILKFNNIIDSLTSSINIETTEPNKTNIANEFNKAKKDLRIKLNSITEFNTKKQVDSLLQDNKDFEGLPNFAITAELSAGKFDGTKSGKLLLEQLKVKTEKISIYEKKFLQFKKVKQ